MKGRIWGCVLGLSALMFLPYAAGAGSLEPSAAPNPTMKTLDQIPPTWDQVLSADVRFQTVMGGAGVLDKETGLVWERSPDTGLYSWAWNSTTANAMGYCIQKVVGGLKGWRLPTVQELLSLVDPSQTNPALPSGHPFSNVQPSNYWSANTWFADSTAALAVHFYDSIPGAFSKGSSAYLWCVRGGSGVDPQ